MDPAHSSPYANGKTVDKIILVINPTKAMMVAITEKFMRVS